MFYVICLNKQNGHIMFFQRDSKGWKQVHNPLQASRYMENEADKLVADYTKFLKEIHPSSWEDYCIAKVKLA